MWYGLRVPGRGAAEPHGHTVRWQRPILLVEGSDEGHHFHEALELHATEFVQRSALRCRPYSLSRRYSSVAAASPGMVTLRINESFSTLIFGMNIDIRPAAAVESDGPDRPFHFQTDRQTVRLTPC